MWNPDGAKHATVNLSTHSSSSSSAVLNSVRAERQARERQRVLENAATKIQRIYRGRLAARRAKDDVLSRLEGGASVRDGVRGLVFVLPGGERARVGAVVKAWCDGAVVKGECAEAVTGGRRFRPILVKGMRPDTMLTRQIHTVCPPSLPRLRLTRNMPRCWGRCWFVSSSLSALVRSEYRGVGSSCCLMDSFQLDRHRRSGACC